MTANSVNEVQCQCWRSHCSATSASQSPAAFLVGQIFVRQNATTCLSLRQEHSSVDGVSMLQPQTSGTRFHHSSASSSIRCGQFRAGLKTHLFTQAYGHHWELLLNCIVYITFTFPHLSLIHDAQFLRSKALQRCSSRTRQISEC